MGDDDSVRWTPVDSGAKSASRKIDPMDTSMIGAKNLEATSDRGELALPSDLGSITPIVVNMPTTTITVKKEASTTQPNCLRIIDLAEEEDIAMPIKPSMSSTMSKLYQNHASRGRSADADFDNYDGLIKEAGVGVTEGAADGYKLHNVGNKDRARSERNDELEVTTSCKIDEEAHLQRLRKKREMCMTHLDHPVESRGGGINRTHQELARADLDTAHLLLELLANTVLAGDDLCKSLISADTYLIDDGTTSPNTMNPTQYIRLFLYIGNNVDANRCHDGELYVCGGDFVFANAQTPPLYSHANDRSLSALQGLFIDNAVSETKLISADIARRLVFIKTRIPDHDNEEICASIHKALHPNWDYAKISTHGKVYEADKSDKIGDMVASARSWRAGDMVRRNGSKMRNAFRETRETKKPDGGDSSLPTPGLAMCGSGRKEYIE